MTPEMYNIYNRVASGQNNRLGGFKNKLRNLD